MNDNHSIELLEDQAWMILELPAAVRVIFIEKFIKIISGHQHASTFTYDAWKIIEILFSIVENVCDLIWYRN